MRLLPLQETGKHPVDTKLDWLIASAYRYVLGVDSGYMGQFDPVDLRAAALLTTTLASLVWRGRIVEGETELFQR